MTTTGSPGRSASRASAAVSGCAALPCGAIRFCWLRGPAPFGAGRGRGGRGACPGCDWWACRPPASHGSPSPAGTEGRRLHPAVGRIVAPPVLPAEPRPGRRPLRARRRRGRPAWRRPTMAAADTTRTATSTGRREVAVEAATTRGNAPSAYALERIQVGAAQRHHQDHGGEQRIRVRQAPPGHDHAGRRRARSTGGGRHCPGGGRGGRRARRATWRRTARPAVPGGRPAAGR